MMDSMKRQKGKFAGRVAAGQLLLLAALVVLIVTGSKLPKQILRRRST